MPIVKGEFVLRLLLILGFRLGLSETERVIFPDCCFPLLGLRYSKKQMDDGLAETF